MAPVEMAPVEMAPVEMAPVEMAPVEMAPVEMVSVAPSMVQPVAQPSDQPEPNYANSDEQNPSPHWNGRRPNDSPPAATSESGNWT